MPYCPDCGSEIDPDNVYCSNCGRQLDGGTSDPGGGTGDDWGSDDGGQGDNWSETTQGGRDEGGDESWAEASGENNWGDDGDQYGNPGNQPGGGQPGQGRGGQPRGGEPRQGRGGGGQPGQGGGQPRGGEPRQGRGGGGQPGQGNSWEGGQGNSWEGGQGAQRREWGGSNRQPRDELFIEDGRIDYAFKLPFSDGWGPLAISAVFTLLSFLLIPIFFLYGYVYRITEAAAWGDTIQPRFDEYGDMFVSGLAFVGLFIVYGVITFVPVVLLVAVGAEAGVPGVAGIIGLLVGLLFAYFGPAVLTLYPVTGSFSAALSPSRITNFAFTGKYLGSFLLFIVLYFAIQIAFTVLIFALAITVIGLLLVIPLYLVIPAYLLYFTGAYWGATYYEAAQEGLVEPAWGEEEPQQPPQGGEPAGASSWD